MDRSKRRANLKVFGCAQSLLLAALATGAMAQDAFPPAGAVERELDNVGRGNATVPVKRLPLNPAPDRVAPSLSDGPRRVPIAGAPDNETGVPAPRLDPEGDLKAKYKGTVQLTLASDGEAAVILSRHDSNRLQAVGDRIKSVVVNEGAADVTSTEDGMIFLTFTGGSGGSVWVVTEKLQTYKLVVSLVDMPGVQVLINSARDSTASGASAKPMAAAEGGVYGQAAALMRAMVTGVSSDMFVARPGGEQMNLLGSQALVVRQWTTDDGFAGRELLLAPGGARDFDEASVAVAIPGTIAVLFSARADTTLPWTIYAIGRSHHGE